MTFGFPKIEVGFQQRSEQLKVEERSQKVDESGRMKWGGKRDWREVVVLE